MGLIPTFAEVKGKKLERWGRTGGGVIGSPIMSRIIIKGLICKYDYICLLKPETLQEEIVEVLLFQENKNILFHRNNIREQSQYNKVLRIIGRNHSRKKIIIYFSL